jgi:hypothetical protein
VVDWSATAPTTTATAAAASEATIAIMRARVLTPFRE